DILVDRFALAVTPVKQRGPSAPPAGYFFRLVPSRSRLLLVRPPSFLQLMVGSSYAVEVQRPLDLVSSGFSFRGRSRLQLARDPDLLVLVATETGRDDEQDGKGTEGRGRQPLPPALVTLKLGDSVLTVGGHGKSPVVGGSILPGRAGGIE